jgi:P27 family predicted phage terminase small subunit
MGKRGPAPKPTALRLLHGDRPSRVNTDEPIPDRGLPECPDDVSDEVRAIWDYTVRQIDVMGMSSRADRDTLRAYCEAVITHRRSSALLAKSEVLVKSALGGPVRNPAVAVQRDAAQTLVRLAQQFGLTPAARSEIRAGVAPAVPDNPFATFGGS